MEKLSWLHSDLAKDIGQIDSIQAWEEYIKKERVTWRGNNFEYAFGDTPLYSFSKAAFTAATRLLSQEVEAEGKKKEISVLLPYVQAMCSRRCLQRKKRFRRSVLPLQAISFCMWL